MTRLSPTLPRAPWKAPPGPSSFPVCRQPFICFLAPGLSSHLLEFNVNGVMQYELWVGWVLSRSIIILRFTHVAYTSSSFLYIAGPGCAQTLGRANPSESILIIHPSLPQAPQQEKSPSPRRRGGGWAVGSRQWDRPPREISLGAS
uniref:Uncharacterized protein n=1 Tax=Myotis myotis TaxID=51298 RepID=A0A7J7WVP2_MYOMY|nr:hypothetical protein mMyoMyo1_011891 [Myotis myotis]